MHVPDHASVLPEHVGPIPIPDTCEEAAVLRFLLDLGFYPTCEALLGRKECLESELEKGSPILPVVMVGGSPFTA